ncbi:ATP-binding cassette domain-containing protein [Acidiphilium sp.]|uniref:ATP-binding cassette domain-containing protein n=1 Tax=Acidiphilium sp. TaxID=527 RepID=UPI003CFDC74C
METASNRSYEHIVRAERLSVSFGKVRALSDIDLAIGRNEIVGLIGDNGAGKSTLIKTLTGVIPPSAGRLFIRDQPVDWANFSVRRAHDLRFETVYQEKSLGEKQPLWRNFFVGRQITNRFGFIKVREQRRIANEILQRQLGFRGVGIDADSTVAKLSGGERQGIAIGRAMHFDADLIILDEPTTALAIKEVQKVLDFVRRIKASGRAAIYIEHNLAHVHALADRLIVLDRGRIVANLRPADLTLEDLTLFLIDLQKTKIEAAT